MPIQGLDIPEWLHKLLSDVNLADIIHAMTNVTLREVDHLITFAKGRELNEETITKLFEEARKLSGAGTALTAAALVIFVIIFCFPMAVATPFLTMLGFTNIGPAAASLVATFQSLWGVNALFSVLQSAAMSSHGASIVAGVLKGGSLIGGGFSAFKLWAAGNYTLPSWKL